MQSPHFEYRNIRATHCGCSLHRRRRWNAVTLKQTVIVVSANPVTTALGYRCAIKQLFWGNIGPWGDHQLRDWILSPTRTTSINPKSRRIQNIGLRGEGTWYIRVRRPSHDWPLTQRDSIHQNTFTYSPFSLHTPRIDTCHLLLGSFISHLIPPLQNIYNTCDRRYSISFFPFQPPLILAVQTHNGLLPIYSGGSFAP